MFPIYIIGFFCGHLEFFLGLLEFFCGHLGIFHGHLGFYCGYLGSFFLNHLVGLKSGCILKISIKVLMLQAPFIDPFSTVVQMREARMKMVQKPIQYHYVIKCLADYVGGEVSEYAWKWQIVIWLELPDCWWQKNCDRLI